MSAEQSLTNIRGLMGRMQQMTPLREGDIAPGFSLPRSRDSFVSLDELTAGGTVVLAFYPGDFSSVCTNELCMFRDGLSEFGQLDARVVGISGDSHFTHEAFRKANRITFDLLSDYDHSVARLYGVAYDDFLGLKGAAKRSVFIVDRERRIRYVWSTESAANLPDLDEIRRRLYAMRGGAE